MPRATTRSEPEPRQSRPVQVAEAIKDWVVSEGLRPGDRLPSEPELMERFGRSKGTVREAMRVLEAQGLIKTRTGPGGGNFVHEVSARRAKGLLGNYFYFKDLSVRDIYQLRTALEPELAASLAGQLPETVLEQLAGIVSTYDAPATTLEEERDQHVNSLRFHAVLAQQSGNALLSFVIDFMVTMLADLTVIRELYALPNHELWSRGRDHQLRLIDALREGRSEDARAIMRSHMEGAWRMMADQETEIARRFMSV
ncbi:FadR/GntR family transcriptional regulator [Mesobacterium pallidum]|uniref:FadR/GntR family transcriptional regulator n=1 Tax=Mesobacterium pallidum TaxID=2872037 RepID=UPI001EE1EC84|nr:GntR family transcriptional regulator [Mesobacterium pallidum]